LLHERNEIWIQISKKIIFVFVSDMNKNISTFKGKVVELQATNHELVLTNNRLESTLRGNQYIVKEKNRLTVY